MTYVCAYLLINLIFCFIALVRASTESEEIGLIDFLVSEIIIFLFGLLILASVVCINVFYSIKGYFSEVEND